VDWNNDGKKDLVIGDSSQYVYVALNTASGTPVFGALQRPLSGGSSIQNPGSNKPTVWIVDWNNDGRKDLITGGESTFPENGYAYLYLNTGTDANPTFAPIQTIDNNHDFGWRTSPVTVDWDGDGKKDLVVTSVYGDTRFWKNIGTDAAPAFGAGVHVATQSGSLIWGIETRVRAVDWDRDGRQDLLIGDRYGEVRLYIKNHPPQLVWSGSATGQVGQVIALNGTGTTDPERDGLTFAWSFVSKPNGSAATIPNPTARTTDFTPDRAGTYEIALTASDGHGTPAQARRAFQVSDPQVQRPVLSAKRLSLGRIELTLVGTPTTTYTVDISADFIQWVVWTNLVSTNQTNSVIDAEAWKHPQRFYRARF